MLSSTWTNKKRISR